MSRVSKEIRNLARLLATSERGEKKHSKNKVPPAFHECEKLRPHFVVLLGVGGFRALLLRSLDLASAEVPWLRKVQVKADGSLEGSEEIQQLDPDEFFEGRAILLAELLGLLVAFIGKNLTLRLLREVWPGIAISDSEFGKGDDYEKTT